MRDLNSKAGALHWMAAAIVLVASLGGRASADETGVQPFKLTIGNYFYDDVGSHYSGQDYNLRWRANDTSAWGGYYHDTQFGDQLRAGADTSWRPIKTLPFYLQPSAQVATRGFVGGSMGVQVGDDWFLQAGLGRTNLRPYVNLNFDPNDSLSVAAGHVDGRGDHFTLSMIRDNRLHTDQQDTHAIVQFALAHDQRLTLDTLYKSGNGDAGKIHVWGESLTYDFPRWFLRLAYDAKQNFATADVTRLCAGMRF